MTLEGESKLITCRVCGVIMVKLVRDICPKCFLEEEKVFQKVRDFLRANNGASLEDIAKHTACKIEQVEAFVRSGRLERIGVKKVPHPCQLCQTTIYEGVVCQECKKTLKEQVNSLKPDSAESEKDKPEKKPDSLKDSGKDVPVSGKKGTGTVGHVGKRTK